MFFLLDKNQFIRLTAQDVLLQLKSASTPSNAPAPTSASTMPAMEATMTESSLAPKRSAEDEFLMDSTPAAPTPCVKKAKLR